MILNRMSLKTDLWFDSLYELNEEATKFLEVYNYKEFLNSDIWYQTKMVIKNAIKKNNIKNEIYSEVFLCEECGYYRKLWYLTPHHIKYKKGRMLDPKYLQFICYSCHKKIHGDKK